MPWRRFNGQTFYITTSCVGSIGATMRRNSLRDTTLCDATKQCMDRLVWNDRSDWSKAWLNRPFSCFTTSVYLDNKKPPVAVCLTKNKTSLHTTLGPEEGGSGGGSETQFAEATDGWRHRAKGETRPVGREQSTRGWEGVVTPIASLAQRVTPQPHMKTRFCSIV